MQTESTSYIEVLSANGTIDVRIRIAMLTVYSVSIFFVDSWIAMGSFAILLLGAMIASKVDAWELLRLCIPVYVICAFTIFFNIFQVFDGAIHPTWEGALRGCFFSSRIILLVLASLTLCLSVNPTSLTRAFCSILKPLSVFKVPVDDIATVLSISLRFIPIVYDEFFRIRDSQWSRGADFDDGPILSRMRSYCSIFIPLIVGLFVSAERLAKAMDIRAYGLLGSGRTSIHPMHANATSWLVFVVSSVVMIAIVFLI